VWLLLFSWITANIAPFTVGAIASSILESSTAFFTIMKASFASSLSVLRTLAAPAAALLLCQCAMPSREAWQYIQSNGLLTYLGSAQRSSPPFHTGHSRTQQSIASQRGFYSPRSPSISSYYAAPPRQPRAPYQPSRYYAAPSQDSVVNYDRRPSPVRPKPAPAAPQKQKMSVEEPNTAAQIVKNDTPSRPPSPTPNTPPSAPSDLPYGTAVPGRTNMVNSPYAGKTQLVDVSGMGTGQTVKCPYTGKLFKVPPQQQASNSTTPPLESKIETPKTDSPPKAEDKKP
jgi:hypothetical protein